MTDRSHRGSGERATATTGLPGRRPYVLAAIVLVAGFVGMAIVLATQLPKLTERLVQVVVPGQAELVLEPGSYTIFHENRSIVDGRLYEVTNISGLSARLVSPQGEPVALTPVTMDSTYQLSGRTGRAAFGFEIGEAGSYLLSAGYGEGEGGPDTVLAVGQGFVGGLMWTIFIALGFAFAGTGLALVIALPVFLKRRRAARA